MSSQYIHTDLALNAWEPTSEGTPIIDPETSMSTVRIPVTFRGSRQSAVREFRFGAQNCPHGGNGMFCMGPADIQLVPNTGADPHWDIVVEWTGIHTELLAAGGSGTNYAYNVKIDWAHREKNYPEEVTTSAGSPLVVSMEYPFAPTGDSTGGNKRKSKRLDHLPTATINVAMNSPQAPNPAHPYIKTILALLPTKFPGVIQDYTGLTEPTWVTWADRPAPKAITGVPANPANWFIRQIQTARRISTAASLGTNALHVFTITATLEQLLQPTD